MIENNRIIVVDDSQKDLDRICNVFYEHGIGCRKLQYNGWDFPQQPFSGVRFAFFDVNLISGKEENEIYSTLKDAISHYISTDNGGPYILVFWSNRTELIPGFIKFINRTDDDFRKKLKPVSIAQIDKTEFLDETKQLDEKLNGIFSTDIVKCLAGFDDTIIEAAQETLNSIISTIPFEDPWGESSEFDKNCKAVFSRIAASAHGFPHAKENPDLAIKEAVAPIFKHILLKKTQTYWQEYLTPLKKAQKDNEIPFLDKYDPSILNSIFHIDAENHYSKTDRGAVCPISSEHTSEKFTSVFKIDFPTWFTNSFPRLKKEDRKDSTPIAIEFSASCDYSNNKKRTNKYLLGALIPKTSMVNLQKERLGDFTLILPHPFLIKKKKYQIGVNLNFTFTEQDSNPILGEPAFALKKEIMDMIGNKYANHIARIGIASFH